jgi:hypothetical protein
MKKLIAILAVFSLLTTAVFAQVSIGGSVGMGALLINGNSDDDDATIDMRARWGSVTFDWSSPDNTAGGKIKINGEFNKNAVTLVYGENPWDNDTAEPVPLLGGRVWWRPIEFLRLEFTNLEDEGVFGRGNAIDWGFNANSAPDNITGLWDSCWNGFANSTLRSGHGFFGGLGGEGENVLALSIFPIDGLALNFAWALGSDTTEDFFKRTLAQLTYDIAGIGNLGLSFHGNQGNSYAGYRMTDVLAADFTLTAIDGMNIEISAKIPLNDKGFDGEKTELSQPIEIGLGYTFNQWSGEAFHFYARAGVVLPSEDFV